MTLDLSRMSATTYNDNGKEPSTASIGPGARWGSVYTALAKYGVTVGGGRGADVGVGGLVLGGPYEVYHFPEINADIHG